MMHAGPIELISRHHYEFRYSGSFMKKFVTCPWNWNINHIRRLGS